MYIHCFLEGPKLKKSKVLCMKFQAIVTWKKFRLYIFPKRQGDPISPYLFLYVGISIRNNKGIRGIRLGDE